MYTYKARPAQLVTRPAHSLASEPPDQPGPSDNCAWSNKPRQRRAVHQQNKCVTTISEAGRDGLETRKLDASSYMFRCKLKMFLKCFNREYYILIRPYLHNLALVIYKYRHSHKISRCKFTKIKTWKWLDLGSVLMWVIPWLIKHVTDDHGNGRLIECSIKP